MSKARRNKTDKDIFNGKDPLFGAYTPEFHLSEENKNNNDLHPEIRKMVYSTLH